MIYIGNRLQGYSRSQQQLERIQHISVKNFFLWDLKESGDFSIVWLPSAHNTSDIFTKNLDGPTFAKHAGTYVF